MLLLQQPLFSQTLNPTFPPKSKPSFSQTLSLSNSSSSSFYGLHKPLHSRFISSHPSHSRRSLVVRASELPLVGNVAPDFEAGAVFDQEFIKFSHLAWVQTDRGSLEGWGIALRGLFIIDMVGFIQHSAINILAIGRSVDETMRALQALQYVQDNPDEVCPAGWKPGDKSMKPDPKLSKDYFAAV